MKNGKSRSSLGHSENDSDEDENSRGGSRHSADPSAHAENRKRISISEYKQRAKKPEEGASNTSFRGLNNNDVNFRMNPASAPTPAPAPAPAPVAQLPLNPPHQNGQIVFNSIEDYYAHIYCMSTQGQQPPQVQAQLQSLGNPPLPSVPAPSLAQPPFTASYPHWSQAPQRPAASPLDSRMSKVNDWNQTNSRFKPHPSNSSFQAATYNGESPVSRFQPPPPQEKTPKMTPASALNDPNEATSYREWRKRKYGTEDAPTPTNSNGSKFKRTDSWRGKGGPRNDRQGRQGQNKENNWGKGNNWGNSGSDGGALDSWDDGPAPEASKSLDTESWDDGPAPEPSKSLGTECWDDGPAPEPSKSLGTECWDDGPAPEPSKSLGTESWDDGPAPEPSKSLGTASWDDGPAPEPSTSLGTNSWASRTPAPVADEPLGLDSWDDGAAPPQPSAAPPIIQTIPDSWDTQPPKNYGSWEASSGKGKAKPKDKRSGLESWDDEPPPPGGSVNWGAPAAAAAAKPLQDGLESWDDEAPAPQASKEALATWGSNPPQPPANAPADSWDTDNQSSRSSDWGSNRQQRNGRGRNNYRGRSRKDSDNRSTGSRDQSDSNNFRCDYRGGSRSSDNSDSGNSNRQGYRGNRGRRSGSRDSGNWSRNNSRDRSEGRPWNNRKSFGDQNNQSSYGDRNNQNNYGDRNNRNSFGDRGNNRRNSTSSWGQSEPTAAALPAETTGESWDDDVATPQPSKEFASSWGKQRTSQRAQDSWASSSATSAPLSAGGLESWDDDVPPPQAREDVPPPAVENSISKTSDMVRALCTTCSFEIIHRCKFQKDPSTSEELKSGELFTCACGMAFLHDSECIDKVGDNYAPIAMETGLMKQVGRTHIYICKVCDFKFMIENLKDGSHFFKQMTTKKGDKMRQATTVKDPQGFEVFTLHIERFNNVACLGRDSATVAASLQHKMAGICQCNQNCCTIYHECEAYRGELEEGETV